MLSSGEFSADNRGRCREVWEEQSHTISYQLCVLMGFVCHSSNSYVDFGRCIEERERYERCKFVGLFFLFLLYLMLFRDITNICSVPIYTFLSFWRHVFASNYQKTGFYLLFKKESHCRRLDEVQKYIKSQHDSSTRVFSPLRSSFRTLNFRSTCRWQPRVPTVVKRRRPLAAVGEILR